MADAQSFLKRGTPSKWPDELVVITDPKHPGYDERIDTVPVTDERIRNFVAVGQVQPVSVVVRGDDLELNAGRQRWKRATVINHIVGVRPYTGKLPPILEAIARIKGTEFAKWIADTVPNGMKLAFSVYRGDEKEAAGASTSENEQRDEDPIAAKQRRAQRMLKQGHSIDDVATYFGVSAQTVKRWATAKPDVQKTKKTRGPATRPSAKKIAAILEGCSLSSDATNILRWAMGAATDEQLVEEMPGLANALAPKAKAKKAA